MLYTEEAVRANIRNRQGRRVFFLERGDTLTSGARDWLKKEKIEILPGEQAKIQVFHLENGGYMTEKPEGMTHLHGDVLVEKTHPRIRFRGKLDTLESALLLAGQEQGAPVKDLQEILNLTREILKCEVLDSPLEEKSLLGLSREELRRHSHFPQKFCGQPHFMPAFGDGPRIARLNAARCAAREAEIAAVAAFPENRRPDLLQAMNRLSSAIYLLMIREKAAFGAGQDASR